MLNVTRLCQPYCVRIVSVIFHVILSIRPIFYFVWQDIDRFVWKGKIRNFTAVKLSQTLSTYLKFTGFISIFVLLLLFYLNRASYSLSKMEARPLKNSDIIKIQPLLKKMAPGAACCKGSFSRTAVLKSESSKAGIPSDHK